MVKPLLFIKFKESHSYFLQDETIPCIVEFKSEKVLKDGFIRVRFMGRSSSYANGSRQHLYNIFTVEKEIKIDEWNNAASIKTMHQVEFTVEVPNGKEIPSYRNLDGGDGGKIEYMIEASLETRGGLFKKSNILTNHILPVPLIAKININTDGIERPRESSIHWPKLEENGSKCVLSARIPHGGCIRGKEVPVRVEFQQPERFDPIKSITISLVQQEIMASSKDSIPEMTKQLADRITNTEKKLVTMAKDMYNQLLTTNNLIMFKIPSNVTPTIGTIAKVMRVDYKIRVTVNIASTENDKEKELSVNLPLVVGTEGEYPINHDSGLDTRAYPNETSSINIPTSYNPFNPYSPGYNHDNISFGSKASYPPHLLAAASRGFHVPDTYQTPPQPYLSILQDRFVLNPEQMSYIGSPNKSNYEGGMPVPDVSSLSTSPVNDQPNAFVYPPVCLKSRSSTLSASTNPFSANNADTIPYPPNKMINPSSSTSTTSRNNMPSSPIREKTTDIDTNTSSLSRESTRSTTHSNTSHTLYPPTILSIDKPNTPTPPQTPAALNRNLQQQQQQPVYPTESGSSYYSGASTFNESVYSSSPPQTAGQTVTRIDPLDGTIALSNVHNK